ncbi:hypothetical protein PybrP1_006843 [[Pythium] brassicae (nom. inval.)]|nr:hypothetical protein PybrP1_006843 [[Pythium] brassicae (nom. inval.)]
MASVDSTLLAAPSLALLVPPTATASYSNSSPSASPTAVATSDGTCVLKKYYTCSAPEKERVVHCERDGCPKLIHRSCSLRVTEPFRDAAEPLRVVCGKRCFNAVTKGARAAAAGTGTGAGASSTLKREVSASSHAGAHERKKRSPWNSDGPSPTVSSLSVLLAWLREPKNYARWVHGGDQNKFETKAAIATQILTLIKAKGIDTDRNRNDVFAKIYQLEKSFAEASEWVAANQHQLEKPALDAGAKKRCMHYSDLYASMSVYGKGGSAHVDGAVSSRKRTAATEPASADATKRQHVVSAGREIRARAPEHVVVKSPDAAKSAVAPSSAEPSAIAPSPLSSHAFLASAASDPVSAAQLAALSASLMLANGGAGGGSANGSLSTPHAGGSSNSATSSGSLLQLNQSLLQAATDKLHAEARIASVAASTALLRARMALRAEGVPQDEIDVVLPLVRE